MGLTCPRCGGQSVRPVDALGHFECLTERLMDVIPAAPLPGSPKMPVYRRCGHRFQAGPAGSGLPSCFCRVQAIATCAVCGAPLCYEHLHRRSATTFCPGHAAEAEANAQRRAREEHERERQQYFAAVDAWKAVAAEGLATVPNPVERLVRAVGHLGCDQPWLREGLVEECDDRAVAEWFCGATKKEPYEVRVRERGLFGGMKQRKRRGWWFFRGSTLSERWGNRTDVLSEPRDILVLSDGRILYGDEQEGPKGSERFAPSALAEMCKLADLGPLDIPPRPKPTWDPLKNI